MMATTRLAGSRGASQAELIAPLVIDESMIRLRRNPSRNSGKPNREPPLASPRTSISSFDVDELARRST
jgi:hypothetical protein